MTNNYSVNITQTSPDGQSNSTLSFSTSDATELMRVLANAGLSMPAATEAPSEQPQMASDDPNSVGMCPVCMQDPCACEDEGHEHMHEEETPPTMANKPKEQVVSEPGGDEYGEQHPQQDQRRVTARQGDNPMEDEDQDKVKESQQVDEQAIAHLEQQLLAEWAKFTEEQVEEKAVNPYAVGMAQAMQSTGDKPPLEKSTITKAHRIAKSVMANEENGDVSFDETPQLEGKKPDFLDLDKDGDKKEPMKKAADDKEEKMEEAAKPDYIDLDKDGDKEEPMSKAAKDKEETKEETKESQELDNLRYLINWKHSEAKLTAVSQQDINQNNDQGKLDDLAHMKALLHWKPVR